MSYRAISQLVIERNVVVGLPFRIASKIEHVEFNDNSKDDPRNETDPPARFLLAILSLGPRDPP